MTDTICYTPALIPIARTLAARGALEQDLATAFGVSFKTIRAWKQQHPDFAAACRLPRDAADAAVERALFRAATGYDREAGQVVLKDSELIRTTVTEHVPPNDKAATVWLRVRRPDRWRAPPPVIRSTTSDLTLTEETLRAIEEDAYDAYSAARDGEPAIDGDDDALERIDALTPGVDAPADDGDPVTGLEIAPRRPCEDRGPCLSPSEMAFPVERAMGPCLRRGDEKRLIPACASPVGNREHAPDTLPHPIHPPLPELITAPLVEPIDTDPPAPSSKYDPAFIPQARHLSEHGALERDLARAFGVSSTIIRQWTLRHAAFGQAVRLSKAVADDAVEAALFARATGYSYVREKILFTEDGEAIRTEILVEQPPSLRAMLFWLSRRCFDRWSLNHQPNLDPADAAHLIAETRERVAEFDLHRRHWRTHRCAPPGRDEPEPPEWLRDEEDDGGEDWEEPDEAEDLPG